MAGTIHHCGFVTDDCGTQKSSPRHAGRNEPLWMESSPHGELQRREDIRTRSSLSDSFVASLKACARNKDLLKGTSLHEDLVQRGLLDMCSDAIVTMYAKCGELGKAKALLGVHKSSNPITWTELMAGYVREGQSQKALDCLDQMQHEGVVADAVTYGCALKACAMIQDIVKGKQINEEIVRQGLLQTNVVLGGALVDMYVKCRVFPEARRVLEELPLKNVISWNALISGYGKEGKAEEALDCLDQMRHEGILPDTVTYICALKSCAIIQAVDKGKRIHEEIVKKGLLHSSIVLGGALVDMYAKFRALAEAQKVLDQLPLQSAIAWNALIAGHVRQGEAEQALNCLIQMLQKGISPDAVTYTCALKACATIGAADMGKKIHEEIARQGLFYNKIELGNALVDMYAKCGNASEAQRVLMDLPSRDVISWNTLIAGYTQVGEAEKALNCLDQMLHEHIFPDAVTYTCMLKACSSIKDASRGKQIHKEIARQGFLKKNIELGTALVDMYAKCVDVSEARRVLQELPVRNVISWNALIAVYAQEGEAEQALNCLDQMQHEGILPDAVTYACTLKACATIRVASRGKQIHRVLARQGLLQDNIVLGNALVDMYSKCGYISEAKRVLEELPSRDTISWNALMSGYVQEGEDEQALDCLEGMQQDGILPDAVTYACALKACASIRAVGRGKEIHEEIARQGILQNNVVLGNALVDMYTKCGCFSEAWGVLRKLSYWNAVSWSPLIAGYAQEGDAEQALYCFENMLHEGILPDAVIFASMLNVCSHQGLIEKGVCLFLCMSIKFGVKPNLECYTCIIDLFGRAGNLEKAVRLIQELPFCDSMAIWHALLHACWKWADTNVGGWAFEQAVKLDKSDGSAYILMANIYAAAGIKVQGKKHSIH